MTGVLHRKRLRQALDLKSLGRLEDAETQLKTLTETAPDFSVAWLELARVRLDRGLAREAFETFNRAATFMETAADARLHLGRLARPGAGDHLRDRNFRMALAIDPALVPALADLSDLRAGRMISRFVVAAVSSSAATDPYRELINRGWTSRAVRLARAAAMTRPESVAVQRDLAELAFRVEDLDAKARHLKRAAVGLPKDAEAQIQAAEALFDAESFAEAEVHARRALAIGSAEAAALFWLGRIQRRLRCFDEAEETLARAVRSDPGFDLRVQIVRQGIHPGDFRS